MHVAPQAICCRVLVLVAAAAAAAAALVVAHADAAVHEEALRADRLLFGWPIVGLSSELGQDSTCEPVHNITLLALDHALICASVERARAIQAVVPRAVIRPLVPPSTGPGDALWLEGSGHVYLPLTDYPDLQLRIRLASDGDSSACRVTSVQEDVSDNMRQHILWKGACRSRSEAQPWLDAYPNVLMIVAGRPGNSIHGLLEAARPKDTIWLPPGSYAGGGFVPAAAAEAQDATIVRVQPTPRASVLDVACTGRETAGNRLWCRILGDHYMEIGETAGRGWVKLYPRYYAFAWERD